MSKFKILTTVQLIDCCKTFKWTRTIDQLDIHHTWEPSHNDYTGSNGIKAQEAMKHWQTTDRVPPFKDIGQHLTLLPYPDRATGGMWVTGRDFNLDPASIAGENPGNFAIEMWGNFDIGHDKFQGIQAESVFKFAAFFIPFMKLDYVKNIRFHRDNPNAGKTCPGTSIDKDIFIKEVIAMGKAFKDVDDNRWSAHYIEAAKELGLISGNPDGTFNPEGQLTREQAAVITVRLYEKITGKKVV